MKKFRRLTLGLCICSAACASTGGTPHPFPLPSPHAKVPSAAPPADVASATPSTDVAPTPPDDYALVGTALDLRGVPYRDGGTDLTGFDCSGFTQYVFARYGIALPREVRDQFDAGAPVDLARLEPGDLVFFATTAPGASHVGIAVGGDAFIHAPSSTGVVRVERFSSSYWASRFVGGRRIIPHRTAVP